jgi:hypothetical protein
LRKGRRLSFVVMNINLVARPAITRPLTSHLPWPSCPAIVGRRYESSFRRTKQRLRIKPDASFALTQSSPQKDHIVFNPPSSAPSVYHTPYKFLPKDDRRRDLLAPSHQSTSTPPPRLPPPVRKVRHEQNTQLGENDVAEIRRLRGEDPVRWSRVALAEKFGCAPYFVALICQASRKHRDAQAALHEEARAKWGRRKTMARQDRTRRRETWGRDDDVKEEPRTLRSFGRPMGLEQSTSDRIRNQRAIR